MVISFREKVHGPYTWEVCTAPFPPPPPPTGSFPFINLRTSSPSSQQPLHGMPEHTNTFNRLFRSLAVWYKEAKNMTEKEGLPFKARQMQETSVCK